MSNPPKELPNDLAVLERVRETLLRFKRKTRGGLARGLRRLLEEVDAHLQARHEEHEQTYARLVAETRAEIKESFRELARARAEGDESAIETAEAAIEHETSIEREADALRRLPPAQAEQRRRELMRELEAEFESGPG